MKTKVLFRNVIKRVSYIMVFLFATSSAFAQCPTISNPAPTICDASGYTFADLSTDYAVDGGNGIVWYDVLSGGSPFNPNQLVKEGTYFADDNSGTCGARASIVVDFQVDASGQNLDQIYCSNENPTIQTYIDDVLQPHIPFGGSVEVYTDIDLTTLTSGTDPIPRGAINFFIVFVDIQLFAQRIAGLSNAPFKILPVKLIYLFKIRFSFNLEDFNHSIQSLFC